MKIKDLPHQKRRLAMIDQFSKGGGFKETYLSALIDYQEWAETMMGPDIQMWYSEPAVWEYMNHLHEGGAAA